MKRASTFFVISFLAPLSHPRLFLAPPGEKEEPTAIFGYVCEVNRYTCHCTLRQTNRIFSFSTCLSSGYFFALNTRPNMAVGSLWLLGSDTNFAAAQSAVPCGPAEGWANLGSDPKNQRAGGVSGAKKRRNTNLSITSMPEGGRTYTERGK